MRYFLALLIPIGLVIFVFSVLAILTGIADSWSLRAQDVLTEVVAWWAHYWWMIALVLGSGCLIWAVVSDARAPAKAKR